MQEFLNRYSMNIRVKLLLKKNKYIIKYVLKHTHIESQTVIYV